MKEKYYRVKGMYKDYIVFVKSGNFWNVFFEDALIIHDITGYKISHNKLGFPSKVLNKVSEELKALTINYVLVYELNDIVVYEYPFNSYIFYLDKCKFTMSRHC